MSYIKRFLEDVVETILLHPNQDPKEFLTELQYSFYIENKKYIDSYVNQEEFV